MVTSGFILGKFLPLHKGHQYLIDHALAHVDHLSIVIYDNHAFKIPLAQRLAWFHLLYPHMDIIPITELYDLDFTSPETWQGHEQLLRHYLPPQVTHFFSSEDRGYYDHLAQFLGVKHIIVDQDRTVVPINGTTILSDLERYREFLDPRVYTSLRETMQNR